MVIYPYVNIMSKKIAILQSNYIPWKGYFDLINMVDEFILFDDMQYTRRDWRNRNKIKTQHGIQWLTIPVEVKGKYYQKICETLVCDSKWGETHWKTILHNYSKAKFFAEYKDLFEELFLNSDEKYLSLINFRLLSTICKILGINTHISWSMDYEMIDGKTERLVHLCKQAKATEYLAGPASKNYIDENLFEEAKIKLSYIDYSGYPEYCQLFPPFVHEVSIIDLIFNEGHNTQKFMKSFDLCNQNISSHLTD